MRTNCKKIVRGENAKRNNGWYYKQPFQLEWQTYFGNELRKYCFSLPNSNIPPPEERTLPYLLYVDPKDVGRFTKFLMGEKPKFIENKYRELHQKYMKEHLFPEMCKK